MDHSDNKNINEIQEQYDQRKFYMPSFFRINLGVLADFKDVSNIPFGSFSAFLHEYVHFLQDVTTMYGLMVLGNTTYYIRDVASRYTMKSESFDVPQKLTEGKTDYGLLNANLRDKYKGTAIRPMRRNVDILNYEVKNLCADSPTLETVVVTCIDNITKEEFVFEFGGNILTEGMAYIVQRVCYDKVYEDNGVPHLTLSDYPYMINIGLVDKIYPEIAAYNELLVGIADISLLTYNAGTTYVKLLEYLRDIKFLESHNGENMVNIFDDLYAEGHKFVNWDVERFREVQDYTFNEFLEYFKMPIAKEVNDWVKRMWEKAFELRRIAPHYIIDLMVYDRNKDVRENRVFCTIYRGLGTPLIINGDDEGAIVPPEGFKPSEDFMPEMLWAVEEIARIFDGHPSAVPCQLYDYCKKSAQEHKSKNPHLTKTIVDERCEKEPWVRSLDDNALCPVAAIWRHWGLKNCTPNWKGNVADDV